MSVSKTLKLSCYGCFAVLTLFSTLSTLGFFNLDQDISYQEALLLSQNNTYSLDGTRKYFQITLEDKTIATILVPPTVNCERGTYIQISVRRSLLTGKDVYSFVGCNLNISK